MARDKLSIFFWYKLLVNFFFGPRSLCEPRTWRLLATRDWGAKLTLLPVDKHTKPSGWGTTLSKTHNMPKKSRAAREKKGRVPPLLPMFLWLEAWAWRGQRSGSGRQSRRCARHDFFPIHEAHYLHQEITLVYICRIRMRLYVIKSLNDIYMSNNF